MTLKSTPSSFAVICARVVFQARRTDQKHTIKAFPRSWAAWIKTARSFDLFLPLKIDEFPRSERGAVHRREGNQAG